MSKNIEEKYKSLTDIEHVLLRPGMYIGSVVTEKTDKYILNKDTNKFELKSVDYNAGFIKLFDEIISNSVDESKREDTKLNTIKVIVSKLDNSIVVWDNGGIPVEMHKKEKKYVPELCFGRLRSGSNFNDDENREGVGTNGLGSVAANIFSTEFVVETADGKNKFKQSYSKNMSKQTKPVISNSFQHFTRITYIPDFERFGMTEIDDDAFSLIESRVYEVAGTNPNLNVYLNDKLIKIKSFKDYCMMFLDNEGDLMFDETDDHKWSIGVAPSQNGFQNISFVNSVNTFMGGSHVEFILNQFIPEIREKVNKKYKTDILPGQIKNQICLFVNATVSNPKFSSQTKERMISEPSSFINPIKLTDKFITQICKSEIVNLITDWLEQKKNADEKKAEREANKVISKVKVEKLVDCKFAGGLKKDLTSLTVVEGDSAGSGFRKFRNAFTQGMLSIRGKILNVRCASKDKIRANAEIQGIMAAMGLKFGISPFEYRNGKLFKDNLRIHEIRIASDQDFDGYHISGLLINFFAYFWPELIKEHRLARIDTPILIARQGKKVEKFYYQNDFDDWCKKNDLSKWEIEYNKGLGSLNDDDYKELVQTPNLYYYEFDDLAKEELDIWFGNDTEKRKGKL
jgi:DNA topoisomerase II